jgi:hypothetical protein
MQLRVQPSHEQCSLRPNRTHQQQLLQHNNNYYHHQQLSRPVEDCDGYPALAGVRNLGLDDPSAVVQIYIAISATEASRRVERLQRAEPGPSSGGVPAELFVGPNGRRLRSAWHVVASMHPINQNVSAPCDSARWPTRCHAPCQAGGRSRPRLRRRQCPKRPVRRLQSFLRHTGERIGSRRWLHHGPDQVFRFVRSALGRWWR